jgi:hypothetical protein
MERTSTARRTTSWGLLPLASLFATAACSSAGPLYPDVASFCSALAAAECQDIAPICGLPQSTCTTNEAQACQSGAQSALAGQRTYQPNNAPACVNLAKTTYAVNGVTPAALATFYAACNQVFLGDVGNLQPCTGPYQCQNGDICDKGYCGTPVVKQQGQPCGDPGETCVVDSYCSSAATPVQCLPASTTLCSAEIPCTSAYHCVAPIAGSSNGTCEVRSTAGEPCLTNDDCGATAPYCDTFDGHICLAGQEFAPAETALCQSFGWNNSYGQTVGIAAPVVTDGGAAADAD